MLLVAALALGSQTWPQPVPPPPLVGFSFSPLSSIDAGRNPSTDLKELLKTTHPDLVRLPVYWDVVQPEPNRLDFSSVDSLLAAIAHHNRSSPVKTAVVLTVGARNFLYPELHMPVWAGARGQPDLDEAMADAPYRAYFVETIKRYRSSPLLYAWQVENEPLDNVVNEFTGDDQITPAQLEWEMAQVHALDPDHMAVTTTYNGINTAVDLLGLYAPPLVTHAGTVGHPNAALRVGDALGLDAYIDGPSVPLRHVTSPGLRSEWKQQTVAMWAARARAQGKELWLAEMQAQPWDGSGGFSPGDLVVGAKNYREEPLQVVMLWGVETWLVDPDWMSAATQAMDVLRS